MSPMNPMTVPVAHWTSLSDLRNGADGKADWTTRGILYGLLLGTIGLSFWRDVDLDGIADALVGGYALVAGVLIAVFAQLAAWRTRLDDRAAFRPRSEAPARRLVDAAVAHALVGVLASAIGVGLAVLVGLEAKPVRVWNALAAGFGVYLLALIIIIVNTAYAAYQTSIDEGIRESDEELLRPERPRIEVRQGALHEVKPTRPPARRR